MAAATSYDAETVVLMLRWCVALTYAGHGALAFGVNKKWLKYLNIVGYSDSTGTILMPVIGLVDLAVAVAAVLLSEPLVFAWATLWAIATALMRPLAGEGVLEFVERAGNFMPSLALLFILTGGQTAPWWFTRAASVATIATHGADSFVAHLVAMAVVFVIGVVYCVVLRLACGATKPHSA